MGSVLRESLSTQASYLLSGGVSPTLLLRGAVSRVGSVAENPYADHSHPPSRRGQPGELGNPRYILRADRPQEFLGLVGRSDPNPLVLTELGAALAFWAG